MFLETLGEMCERTGNLIHSYVLMSNHYHLLIEAPGLPVYAVACHSIPFFLS